MRPILLQFDLSSSWARLLTFVFYFRWHKRDFKRTCCHQNLEQEQDQIAQDAREGQEGDQGHEKTVAPTHYLPIWGDGHHFWYLSGAGDGQRRRIVLIYREQYKVKRGWGKEIVQIIDEWDCLRSWERHYPSRYQARESPPWREEKPQDRRLRPLQHHARRRVFGDFVWLPWLCCSRNLNIADLRRDKGRLMVLWSHSLHLAVWNVPFQWQQQK